MTLSLLPPQRYLPSSPDSASCSPVPTRPPACCIRITTPAILVFSLGTNSDQTSLSSAHLCECACQQTVGAQHQPPTNTAAMGQGPHCLRRANPPGSPVLQRPPAASKARRNLGRGVEDSALAPPMCEEHHVVHGQKRRVDGRLGLEHVARRRRYSAGQISACSSTISPRVFIRSPFHLSARPRP